MAYKVLSIELHSMEYTQDTTVYSVLPNDRVTVSASHCMNVSAHRQGLYSIFIVLFVSTSNRLVSSVSSQSRVTDVSNS